MEAKFELTPKQAEYINNCNHRWNVASGAVRSGKSYCQISWCIPYRLMERKGKRGLRVILGATRDNIERNILSPMRDIFGDSIASSINSKNVATILGEKVYCIGADNIRQVSKIRGSEIAYCAIDEAIDINEEVFEMLKSRLSLPYSCCDITTNPAGPNHWFKNFLDSRNSGVDIYLQEYQIYDNPFLPKDYVKALESEYAGSVWFDRYILGLWALAEGLIYANYKDAIFEEDFENTPESVVISLDYGTSNPFAGLLWEKRSGIWYATKELYYSGRDTGIQKTDDEYLRMLEAFASEVIDFRAEHTVQSAFGSSYFEKIPVIIDPSAASFIALLRKSPYFKPITANNDVINGIRKTSTAIQRGLIKVHMRCKNWQEEAQAYIWDKDAQEDRPIKNFDHLMDATRYFVNTMRIVQRGGQDDYVSRFS